MSTADPRHALVHDAVSLRGVLFQSVTTMGPGVGLAFAVGAGAGFAGGGLALSVLVAMVACLLVAYSIGQLAQHLPSAGGPAAYTARGLHPIVGAIVAWGYGFTYLLALPFLALLMGYFPAGILHTQFGWTFGVSWVACSLIGLALTFVINFGGIRESTRVGVVLGAFEILVFLALALTLIIVGHHNDVSILSTRYATVKGFVGLPGIFAGSVYAILAFIGFDASAPLGEEAKNPRRAVKFAVIGACLMVGLYYFLGTYAAEAYLGPKGFASFNSLGSGDPWIQMAKDVWGIGWLVILLALLNSAVANTNGIANAATRVAWSLGRSRILPRQLSDTNPTRGTPTVATIGVFIFATVVTIWLGEAYTPQVAYALLGTMVVGLVIPIYMLVNVASFGYYLRFARDEFNWIRHALVPVLGVLAFVFPLLAGLGLAVVSFIAPLTPPISYAGPVVIALYVVGVLVIAYHWQSHPDRVIAIGRTLNDDPTDRSAPPAMAVEGD
ncbi:MAG TPA: APC family permease [Candidatus Dormibacteraeota bacterium]|nr:APC family permease [Candidatus Dormibacteraeota bacterium]